MGALGTIKKDMENRILPKNLNIREIQKITLLSTAHAEIIISDNNLNLGLSTTDAASDQRGPLNIITSPVL